MLEARDKYQQYAPERFCEFLITVGTAYFDMGDMVKAEELYRKCLEENLDSVEACVGLARVLIY